MPTLTPILTNSLTVLGTDTAGLQCGLKINADPNNISQYLAPVHWFTSADRTGPTNITLEVDTGVTVNKSLTIGNNDKSITIGGLLIGNNGYSCKAGTNGLISGHSFSVDWVDNNTPNLWIDNVNIGKLWVGGHPEIIKETVVSCWAVRTLGNLASHFTADVQVDGKLTSTKLVIGGDLISAGISIGDSPYKNVYRADTHTFGSVSGVGDTVIKFGGSGVTIGDKSNNITIGGVTVGGNGFGCQRGTDYPNLNGNKFNISWGYNVPTPVPNPRGNRAHLWIDSTDMGEMWTDLLQPSSIGGCTLSNNKISCDAISISDGAILSLGINSRITLGTNSNMDFGLDLSDTTTIRRGLSAGIRTAYSRKITNDSSVMALRTKEPRHINFAWETVESEGGAKALAFYIDGQRQGVINFTPGAYPYP